MALAALSTAQYSILATVAVAFLGYYFNFRSAKGDRDARIAQARDEHEHTERLSRAERSFRVCGEAYAEAARLLHVQQLVVWRADPFAHPEDSPYPDVKDPIGENEWARVMGLVAVHSSRETLDSLEDVRQRMNRLTLAMTALRANQHVASREQEDVTAGRVDRPSDFSPWSSHSLTASQGHVEASRQSALSAINAAEEQMRIELRAI